MSPDRLGRMRTELDILLALPDGQRQGYLAAIADVDAEFAAGLTRALADAERDDPAFEPLVVAPALPQDEPLLAAGHTLGAWRLLRQLGAGGMGQVWLAERADGAYSQCVAIKVPTAAASSATAFARFERERALLAEFDHPGIARLVDGGWTAPGRPWLAMEHIEGERIDAHVRTHDLPIGGRVRLLLDACRVLAAAHRRRVVHRDLKPMNLLVRADGRIAVVDFGIAAALDEGRSGSACLATPRYAAPEQLRGVATTTAADVFSLGVVARELVPSPDVDLAAVFAAATDPDPERRLPDAAALADELERWLAHRPVASRPPSTWHRLRLFVRRDRRSAMALCLLALVAGALFITSLVLWRSEHDARRSADAALLAEAAQHRQVRQLVGDLMTGVYDRVATLPGAVPARTFLAERAATHLAQLIERADTDAELAHEVIEVQLRLADVRGARTQGHVGDVAGALQSAQSALDLANGWAQRRPTEARWPMQIARCRRTCGDLLRTRGELAAARSHYAAAQLALAGVADEDAAKHRLEAVLELQLGKIDVAEGAFAAGLARITTAAAAFDALVSGGTDVARDAALAHAELGYALSWSGAHDRTATAWRAAHDRFAQLCRANPHDAQLRRDRLEIALEQSLDHAQAGRADVGNELFAATLADARELHASDTDNLLSERLLHRALLRGARLAGAQGDHRLAIARYREAEPLLRQRLAQAPDDRELTFDLAEALGARAEAQRLLGEIDTVASTYAQAAALLSHEQALARGDHAAGNLLTLIWVGMGNLELSRGDPAAAFASLRGHRAAASAWADRFPDLPWSLRHLGAFEYALGTACEALAAEAARAEAERLAFVDGAVEAFSRGLAAAEQLAAAGRLRGAEKALPRLFSMDLERVRGQRQAWGAVQQAAGR